MFFGTMFFLLSLFLIFLSKNLIMIWLSLFVSTLASLFFLMNVDIHSTMKYLIIQEVSLILILFGLMSVWELFVLGILMKVGVFPFHNWFINILYFMEKYSLIWIMSFAKILPTILIIWFISKKVLFFILVFFAFNLFVVLFLNQNFKMMLFFSSCSNFFWVLISSLFSVIFSFVYLLMYMFFMFNIINVDNLSFTNVDWFFVLQMTGLPPGALFFIKVLIMTLFSFNFLIMFSFIILMETIIIFNYFKFFDINVLSKFKKTFQNKNLFIFSFLMFFSVLFLIFFKF